MILDGVGRTEPLPHNSTTMPAAEHDGDAGGEIAEAGPVDQLPGGAGFGAHADHQRKQHQRPPA